MVLFRFIRDAGEENTDAFTCEGCGSYEHGIGCVTDVCSRDLPSWISDPSGSGKENSINGG